MKLALNGATTMKADLTTDIRVASDAGFDCLEIWRSKLTDFLRHNTPTDLKALMHQNRIEPYSINSIEHITFRTGESRATLENECEAICRIASQIDCPYIVVVPGRLPQATSQETVVDESVQVLIRLGSIAAGFGVGLAFEFLGQTDCSVQTLSLAHEIVQQVNMPNIGLVIDSFHFYAGGSTIGSIESLSPERLFVFHINDAEDLPRNQLEDRHRLLPGLGVLPLRQILRALRGIKYDGVTSVEIFRPEYWERDPLDLAIAAKKAVADVLAS